MMLIVGAFTKKGSAEIETDKIDFVAKRVDLSTSWQIHAQDPGYEIYADYEVDIMASLHALSCVRK